MPDPLRAQFRQFRVAILGGGISGLAAAHRITELLPNAELSLFEAGNRLGGLLETARQDGFLIEHSADSFTTKFPWAVDLCDRLGIAGELIPTEEARRRALVVCRGKLLPIPDGFVVMTARKRWSLLTTRVLSWSGKLRLLAEPFVPRRRKAAASTATSDDLADESVASFSTRRLGREAFERLVQPLVAGIYTGDAEKLSMAAALPEFLIQEQERGRLLGRQHAATAEKTSASESGARYSLFVTARHGMGQLVEAVASRLPKDTVQFNRPVTAIRRDDSGRWTLTFGTDRPQRAFDAVIVALPAHAAAKILANVDRNLAEELAGIEYASCAIVSLGYRRDQFRQQLDAFGFVVPRIEKRSIIGASFASEKFPGRAPRDHVVIRVFLGGALQPELVDYANEQLGRLAHDELSAIMGITGAPLWTDIAKWPRSMPQYHVGHLARVARIEAAVARLPGLALAGSEYRGVGIPQCIHSGETAAEQIVAGAKYHASEC